MQLSKYWYNLTPTSRKVYTTLALVIFTVLLGTYRLSCTAYTSEITRFNPVDDNGAPLLAASRLFIDTDHMAWQMHAREALQFDKNIVRKVYWDGHPEGREMHWSSLLVWAGKLGAEIGVSVFKLPINDAIESAQPIVYTFLALTLAAIGALLAVWGFGPRYGSLLFLLLLLFDGLFWAQFHPLWFDHHGLITFFLCIFYGSLVRLLLNPTRLVAMIGGISAGLALWISALSSAPAIVFPLLGYGGLLVYDKYKGKSNHVPAWPWAWWGASCALTSLGMYLLEYGNSHTMRLEVNSPLYASGMLGGAILLGALAKWQDQTWKPTVTQWGVGIAGIFMALLPVVCLIIFQDKIFTLFTPLWERYPHVIGEGQATPINSIVFGGMPAVFLFSALVALLLFPNSQYRSVIPFLASALLYMVMLTEAKRIWPFFSIAAVFVVFVLVYLPPARPPWGIIRRILMLLCLVQIIIGTGRAWQSSRIEGRFGLSEAVNTATQCRIAAEALVRDAKANKRKLHIISVPDSSTFLAYYTGGKVKSAIYWESMRQQEELLRGFYATDLKESEQIFRTKDFDYLVIPTDDGSHLSWGYIDGGLTGSLPNPDRFEAQARQGKIPWLKEVPSESSSYKVYRILHEEDKSDDTSPTPEKS